MRRFAFLRAINVGRRTVRMERLREEFTALGFSAVETFIASGNVTFESGAVKEKPLRDKIERIGAHLLQCEPGETYCADGMRKSRITVLSSRLQVPLSTLRFLPLHRRQERRKISWPARARRISFTFTTWRSIGYAEQV